MVLGAVSDVRTPRRKPSCHLCLEAVVMMDADRVRRLSHRIAYRRSDVGY